MSRTIKLKDIEHFGLDGENKIPDWIEEDRHVRNAIAYCFIARAFDIWTPKFWRSDAIAAKIREKDQARAEKEKVKAEKRVPVGS